MPFKIFLTGGPLDLIFSFHLFKNAFISIFNTKLSEPLFGSFYFFRTKSEQSNLNFVALIGFLVFETFEFQEYFRERFFSNKENHLISHSLKGNLGDYVDIFVTFATKVP